MVVRENIKNHEKEYKTNMKKLDAENKTLGFPPKIHEVKKSNNTLKTASPERLRIDGRTNDITTNLVLTLH